MSDVSGTGIFGAPNFVFSSGLSASEIVVLLYLYRRAGPDGCAWPGQARIAKDCALSERTVRDCLLKLKDSGFIDVKPRILPDGSRTSNLYALLTPEIHTPPGKIAPTPRQNSTCKDTQFKDILPPGEERVNTRKRGIPESLQECQEYFVSQGSTSQEGENFWNFYESKGWKVGKSPMVKWKQAVAGWLGRKRESEAMASCAAPQKTYRKYTDEELELLTR